MLLALCLLLCFASAPLAGGSLGRLADIRFLHAWAIAVALAIQLVLVYVLPDSRGPALTTALVASYLLALGFVVANRRVPGLLLIGAGGSLNLLAMAVNGGRMPADPAALDKAGLPHAPDGFSNSLALEGANLAFLGDVFAIPASWPVHNVFSVGDVLLVCGAAVGVHRVSRSFVAAGAERLVSRLRGTLRPLALPVLAGAGAPAAALRHVTPHVAPRTARRRRRDEHETPLVSDLTRSLAEVAVGAANIERGQVVAVLCEEEHRHVVRAVADAAYRRGARFVDPVYFDPWVKRARLEHADESTLTYVPRWYRDRMRALAEEGGAVIALHGPSAPGLFAGLDGARVGLDQLPFVAENSHVIDERRVNWTVVPCPTRGWARALNPDAEPGEALASLWQDIAVVCRLDAEDPLAAWDARLADLEAAARGLDALDLDAVRFRGPGTDLTVGLLPTSAWRTMALTTVRGVRHLANVPTEEVFTAPDPDRVEGEARVTLPVDLDGLLVEGLELRFAGGRLVDVRAEAGEAALRARTELDAGASRLGEVALVDSATRVRSRFQEALLDENAASHIAFGGAYEVCVAAPDVARVNRSGIHLDVMIGGPGVWAQGIRRDGTVVALPGQGGRS